MITPVTIKNLMPASIGRETETCIGQIICWLVLCEEQTLPLLATVLVTLASLLPTYLRETTYQAKAYFSSQIQKIYSIIVEREWRSSGGGNIVAVTRKQIP